MPSAISASTSTAQGPRGSRNENTAWRRLQCGGAAILGLLLGGCSLLPTLPRPTAPASAPAPATGAAAPSPAASAPSPTASSPAAAAPGLARLVPLRVADLPGWAGDDLAEAWAAWLRSCASSALRAKPAYARACAVAAAVAPVPAARRAYFEQQFDAFAVQASDGQASGLLTGYYEPLLRGSRTRSARFNVPLYARPDDLQATPLGDLTRSRRTAHGPAPYWTRAQIDQGLAAHSLRGREIVYVDSAVEALFLQIQGSGRVQLQDGPERGHTLRLAYADHNGQPYRSVGQWLVQQGALRADEASMQGIKAWAARNPGRVAQMLAANPRYVFFREESANADGPRGALNVPLTAGRSVAVDPRAVELGAPVWLDSTEPLSDRPLRRLAMAQDVGGAITGAVRADLFWGSGDEAGDLAGRT
ncbi:MAG: murein transglycosylase A, partial [Betaproteobacteria bacterium]|nr:murein transglycosylase A [Betaproteobacteria bacterium]